MKSTLMKTVIGMLALGLTATAAQAGWERDGHGHQYAHRQSQAYSQHIDARQNRQQERILAGAYSGRLTRAEFRELMREQHTIRAIEQAFRADGVLNAREFQRLDRALDTAARNIRAEKHDRQAHHAQRSRFN